MASESLNSSEDDNRGRRHHDSTASQGRGAPYVARVARGVAVSSSWFPLGYKEGFIQWWSRLPAAVTEHRVLSHLPYLQHEPPTHRQTGSTANSADDVPDSLRYVDPSQQGEIATSSLDDPYGPRRWRSSMVELSGKDRALNEFSVERTGEEIDQHLVMLHGYGAGLGFFYKNFEPLSRLKGWQLHALDMLGMGRSTRPPFRIRAKRREDAIKEAEDWFVDALEEWRVKRNIDRFTLLGHSLGGYIAVVYALKYPGHINKLILASPVGIPEDPHAVTAAVPESETTMVNEFTQDQRSITEPSSIGSVSKIGNVSASASTAAVGPQSANGHIQRRTLPKWFTYLWDANISPFTFVRWAGPFGPRLVSGWTARRFSHLPVEEAKSLHDYAYSIFSQRGSGEYALAYILAPGAFARNPLIRRIQNVGRQIIQPVSPASSLMKSVEAVDASPAQTPSQESKLQAEATAVDHIDPPVARETGIPVIFMYGDYDWMDAAGGYAAKAKMDEEKARILQSATPEDREADIGSAKVVIIKRAGHHLYLDGWEEFNRTVLKEMEEVSQRERGGKTS